MRILWVSHSESLSAGAELCLWEGTRGLVAEDHEVHVVVPAPGRLADRLAGMNVPASVIPYRWWMHSRFRLPFKRLCQNQAAIARLTRLLRTLRPDVVISNTLTVPAGAWAAQRAGVAHVWYIHEFGWEDHGLKFDLGSSLSLRLVSRWSDRVIVNSRAVMKRFRPFIDDAKLRLIYYAVDIPEMRTHTAAEADPFRLCLVGRVCPGKGQEDAIRALGQLRKQGIHVGLALVGNENLEYGRFLRRLAREQSVEMQVEFVAFTEDPFSHLARSHAALVCSRSEAFGRVTVEAMKLGKPVVGGDSAATGELIRNGWNGFLYKPGDAEDLSKKIAALYHNRNLLHDMGENAKAWSRETFSLGNYTSALLEVLQESIADPGKRRRRQDRLRFRQWGPPAAE